jgi:hypothetical protein
MQSQLLGQLHGPPPAPVQSGAGVAALPKKGSAGGAQERAFEIWDGPPEEVGERHQRQRAQCRIRRRGDRAAACACEVR